MRLAFLNVICFTATSVTALQNLQKINATLSYYYINICNSMRLFIVVYS